MMKVKIRNKSAENVTETGLLSARLWSHPAMLVCPVCSVSLRPGATPFHSLFTGLSLWELKQNIDD